MPETIHGEISYTQEDLYFHAAQRLQSILADLNTAARAFLTAGSKLQAVLDESDWQRLGRTSFREYCELDLQISDALAYDLVRLTKLTTALPNCIDRVVKIGVSKARLILPNIEQAHENQDADEIDELFHEAESLSYRDLRNHLRNGDDDPYPERESKYPEIICPHCGEVLSLSRAATIERHERPRKDKRK